MVAATVNCTVATLTVLISCQLTLLEVCGDLVRERCWLWRHPYLGRQILLTSWTSLLFFLSTKSAHYTFISEKITEIYFKLVV